MATVWDAQSGQTNSTRQYSQANITSKFKEEKLIPLIRVARKLLCCDLNQEVKVLRQLARVFQSQEVSFSLMDIIVAGLCRINVYDEIPTAVYEEIEDILPSDKELNLKDSVFESQLMEEQGDHDDNGQTIKKKKKLPITLLRIPTDLQCHLFHYLHSKELGNVQKVCRALCIAARNPSAVYSLEFKPNLSRKGHYQKECYSRPRMLTIDPCRRASYYSGDSELIGNGKWGNNVVDLWCTNFDGAFDVKFQKLEKCTISWSPSVLLNGSISSDETLRELTLDSVKLTQDIIDQIQKFENLERLYLLKLSRNPDLLHYSDPILLPNLKSFSYQMHPRDEGGFRILQMFLIGSNPETVFDINVGELSRFDSFAVSEFIPISKITAIKQLNVFHPTKPFLRLMREWLLRAQSSNFKLFDQIDVNMDSRGHDILPLLIDVLQNANKSKLEICSSRKMSLNWEMDNTVSSILNAPFGTFAEIKMEMVTGMDVQLYIENLLDSLDVQKSEERNKEIIEDVVMESIDKAEKWMKPWLVFNEEGMKQIGLEKLDIEFICNFKPDLKWLTRDRRTKWDQFERDFNQVIHKIVDERIDLWTNCGYKNIRSQNYKEQGYKVTMTLRV